jgi:flagellar hook-associated protein 3 FlgL
MMVSGTLRDLSIGLRTLQHTQAQLTSGRQLIRASDDPSAAAAAMGLRQQMNRADQRSRSLVDAQGWLDTADATMSNGLDRLSRAKEIAVRAANSGGLSDPGARQALAIEVRAIRDDLLALANTKYNGRSLFNGTANGAAYDANGVYQGNAATVVRDVAPQTNLQVNSTGPQIFGVGGGPVGNMFEVLDRLATAISTGNDAGIAAEHLNLDAASSVMMSATVDIGSRAARILDIKSRADDETLRMKSQLSDIEDVDMVQALVHSKAQENAYQAALQTTAKILPVSLLDYLR